MATDRRRSRRVLAVALSGVLLVSTGCSGVGGDARPRLRSIDGSSHDWGVDVNLTVAKATSMSLGSVLMCTRGGPVEISRIELTDPKGITLSGAGVHQMGKSGYLGADNAKLSRLGFKGLPAHVEAECGKDADQGLASTSGVIEVAVTVHLAGADRGSSQGLDIHYLRGGEAAVTHVPFHIGLCRSTSVTQCPEG